MEPSPAELEAYVRESAREVSPGILGVAERARNEADLVAEVEKLLDRFAKPFGVTLRPERERTLISGRADAVYNRLVIEYEPPHSLKPVNTAASNKHALSQLRGYVEGLAEADKQHRERLAGVVLDGSFIIFARYRDGHWHEDEPLPVSAHSTETLLRYLLSLSTELALTPERLTDAFGEVSDVARQMVPALYSALATTESPKVRTLFRQWQQQFSEITGYGGEGGQLDAPDLARRYAVRERDPDLERLFFAIHTYYATFIKLLAVQVAHFYLMPQQPAPLAAVAGLESEPLRRYLADMERGGVFTQLGIRNFLEGDFFGWYLDIWDEGLDAAIRRLIGDLANYSPVTLDVDPEGTRDLLKKLYQNLVPKKLRHALGEYYTPDWLAERLLNQLAYHGNPTKRLLDPACGSGTFLVLAIKRVQAYAKERRLPPERVLEQVLENVVGFDLNPLAVISARTNYLLALGDLLEQRKGEISIPVYLADSVLTPSLEVGQQSFLDGKGGLKQGTGFTFGTAVGRFTVPRALVEARYLDKLADLLEQAVHDDLGREQFKARLLAEFPLDAKQDAGDVSLALRLFEQLRDLERQGINGIWARIIKNAFAPLFVGRFDYVAGNPPWVNWESLPPAYRQEIKPLWVHHNLFPHGGMDTILGKGKKDISMLMTYVAADDYLKDLGTLGFVITQSVFKTAGAGQGFRRLLTGSGKPLRILRVDDLTEVQPFEGASNRTAVFTLLRGRKPQYPVDYYLWRKAVSGKRVPEDATLAEAQAMCALLPLKAQPVDPADPTSAWISGRPKALQAVAKVLGKSDYEAHAGAYTGGANGVYWLEIVRQLPGGLVLVKNITEGAKRQVENVQVAIEPGLLYPLLRSGNVQRWQAQPQAHILMVQDPAKRRGYDESWLSVNYPKTYAYLKHFEEVLRSRAALRRYYGPEDPFYSMFDIGSYSSAPWKAVWGRIASRMGAAVLGPQQARPVMPQETVCLVACSDSTEAHYVCAVLNSDPFDFAVQSHSEKGGKSFGTPGILEKVRVPRYDAADPLHRQLAILSQQAHEAAAAGDEARLRQIEAEVDEQAARLWGLTEAELREIQQSLAELG